MSPRQKNISIIHNCERHLNDWLKVCMRKHGIQISQKSNLSEILFNYQNQLSFLNQHLKQIQQWNKIKEECYSLSSQNLDDYRHDERLENLVEKAAFDGQVLWMTIQEK